MATMMQFNGSFSSFNGNNMFQQQQPQQQQQAQNEMGVLEPTPIDQQGRVQVVQRIDNLSHDLMMNCDEYIALLSNIQQQVNVAMDGSADVEAFDPLPFESKNDWDSSSVVPQATPMFAQQQQAMSFSNNNQMGNANWSLNMF